MRAESSVELNARSINARSSSSKVQLPAQLDARANAGTARTVARDAAEVPVQQALLDAGSLSSLFKKLLMRKT